MIKSSSASAFSSVVYFLILISNIYFPANMSKFGEKFTKVWPESNTYELTKFGRKILSKCAKNKKPILKDTTTSGIVKASSEFPLEFGMQTCRIQNQPQDRHAIIRNQVASAYPIIHERVLYLYVQFLEHKSKYANKIEKKIFSKISLIDFVSRLLRKRCVSFFDGSQCDVYLLLSAREGYGGFKEIGTDMERPPLVLKDVLSYDEIKLSALLSVSSHTEFLNDGRRTNVGIIEQNKSKIELAGVVIGLIGARFSFKDVMEFQDIVISKTQNTAENGYGHNATDMQTNKSSYRDLWKKFYEEDDFLFDQVIEDEKRFKKIATNFIFDNLIMKKRYAISFDTLLIDSEARAAAAGQRAYIHVVGIGLGVWKVTSQQEEIFLLTFTERIKALMPHLNHVAFVHFSWFSMTECGELKHGGMFKSESHPHGGIRTFLSKRNPADKLPRPEYENTLLIVSYAWDGNALPGNEFWMNMFDATGDPSTACSTLITEIHNPHINSKMVCGENLHVASAKYGVIHISEYSKKILNL